MQNIINIALSGCRCERQSCVPTVLTLLWKTDNAGLSDFFVNISLPCLKLTFSTNNLKVQKHSCLQWKGEQIRAFSPMLTNTDTLSGGCQAAVWLHDTRLIMLTIVGKLIFGCRLQTVFTLYLWV